MLVTCAQCGNSFDKSPSEVKKTKSGNHFCDRSCSAKYNNFHRNRKDARREFTCRWCGTTKTQTYRDQIYCSLSCQHAYQWSLKKEKLENGENMTARNCKRYHSEVDYSCSLCGISEWNGSDLTLDLDHIDGDGTTNTLSNTRLLCPNCHSQTDTFKSKNTNNPKGKDFRRMRYKKSLKL